MTGRVLALVPAHNPDPAALRGSLASLEAQTVAIDICVIDDGSAIPVSRLVDQRENIIHLRHDRNRGITDALRAGVKFGLDKGYDYFCRLDVGDLSHPHRVARQLAHMEAHRDIDLLGAFANIMNKSGRRIGVHGTHGGQRGVSRYLWSNAAFKHSTFFLRASAIRRLGNYDAGFIMAQDYELALRMARNGRVDCLAETLVDYVDDPSGLSARHRGRQLRMRLKAQWRHADLFAPRWYLGVARTLALIATPRPLARKLAVARWRPLDIAGRP